jgi:hypothetical protein
MRPFLAALACAAALSCVNYPLETQRDLYEMESVWQYLKVYSIWQERVPENAFSFDSPEIMFEKINDTLRQGRYTGYTDSLCGACMAADGRTNGRADDTDTLEWTALTDSTMLLRIATFEDDGVYRKFLSAVITMHTAYPFRNIIIDLRSNGGGFIEKTDSIISAILPAKTPWLIETYRKYDENSRTAKTVENDTQVTPGPQHWALRDKRYAVLVNNYTASASEMLVAGLKEGFSKAGSDSSVRIVGETTYGKGIGQICISRLYLHRTNLKITFMRMKGLDKTGSYNAKGIAPDIVSEDSADQVAKALSFLEPSAEVNNKKNKSKSDVRAVMKQSPQFPPEAVVVPPPDDRPLGAAE